MVYYVNTVLNKGADIITVFMLASMFASMLGSILAKPFGTRFCKIKLSFWVNLLTAVFGVLCFFVPVQYWIVVLAVHIIISIIQGGNGALQWSMITDANNYGEWKTHRRITGMNVAANILSSNWVLPLVVLFWAGYSQHLIMPQVVLCSPRLPYRALRYYSPLFLQYFIF